MNMGHGVSARMRPNEGARLTHIDKNFVDIRLPALANIMADPLEPGRMIDQALENFTTLNYILDVDAVDAAICLGIHLAVLIARFQRRQFVYPRIDGGNMVGVECVGDDRVTMQVEEVFFRCKIFVQVIALQLIG